MICSDNGLIEKTAVKGFFRCFAAHDAETLGSQNCAPFVVAVGDFDAVPKQDRSNEKDSEFCAQHFLRYIRSDALV